LTEIHRERITLKTNNVSDMSMSKAKASHILVEKHGQALKLLEELKGGAKFADLAKQHSTCPSGKRGGNLGDFGRGQMVKAFETAVFDMKVGETTKEPVKTQFGYHLIKRTG
jgi:peptidyl-prolyl cis-trans isomerase C